MTVLQYFEEQARFNSSCSTKAESKGVSESFLADAEKWEGRIKLLDPATGAQDMDSVILWRIIEELDGKRS